MKRRPLLIVILAAGKGTRMKSAVPKVMHEIAGRTMLGHALNACQELGAETIAVVVGPDMEDVRAAALQQVPDAGVYIQERQDGTAGAVLAAREAIANHKGDVLVQYADTPLLTVGTLERLHARLDDETGVAVLGFDASDPSGYGRLLTGADGWLQAIREDKDASADERRITLCNSGVMAFRLDNLLGVLDRIGNANAKGEFYLTDAIEIARSDGARAGVVVCTEDEVMGINSRDQLALAEALYQKHARLAVMLEGATLIAPETVWFSYDTKIGRDVVIQPNVFFGPGVTIGDNVEILANCHFEQSRIGAGSRVGPFARFRPGAQLGENVRIGNFVEVKNTVLGDGAKANHLSYLGDGEIGAGSNIGAGTIFCNYDGFEKHRTVLGPGVFVGSNASLVAPVKIGEGAYIGAGSVITKNVAADALAVTRASQEERPGWAAKFRALIMRRRAKAG
ncbi:MAG: bifunctional UDP-N-acetylglucosamine diphosphorylase/glucosamine-1-phosphate N-acetyltransferase GlmU [Hyphomicrobium sp.]